MQHDSATCTAPSTHCRVKQPTSTCLVVITVHLGGGFRWSTVLRLCLPCKAQVTQIQCVCDSVNSRKHFLSDLFRLNSGIFRTVCGLKLDVYPISGNATAVWIAAGPATDFSATLHMFTLQVQSEYFPLMWPRSDVFVTKMHRIWSRFRPLSYVAPKSDAYLIFCKCNCGVDTTWMRTKLSVKATLASTLCPYSPCYGVVAAAVNGLEKIKNAFFCHYIYHSHSTNTE